MVAIFAMFCTPTHFGRDALSGATPASLDMFLLIKRLNCAGPWSKSEVLVRVLNELHSLSPLMTLNRPPLVTCSDLQQPGLGS